MEGVFIVFQYISAGAILGVLATLVPFCYRYFWGSKSHISVSRFTTLDDSEWRDGRNESKPIWTRRILVRASNDGWRDGVISNVQLSEVVLTGKSGQTLINDTENGVHKIELEHFSSSGEMTRLSVEQRTSYGGQIIGGRDDELLGIIPFILQESDLGEEMKQADEGDFTFTFTIEDNKRIYETSVDVSTSLQDSAGGKLRKEATDC